jgi:hypothetical protein
LSTNVSDGTIVVSAPTGGSGIIGG